MIKSLSLSLSLCTAHCVMQTWAFQQPPTSLQISSLHFSHPYLLVGTSESDLLVFRLQKRNTSSLTTTLTRTGSDLACPVPVDRGLNVQSLGYRLVTAEHCDRGPILDLFTCPLRTPDEDFRSPFRSTTATPTSLQVLVVCGPKTGVVRRIIQHDSIF